MLSFGAEFRNKFFLSGIVNVSKILRIKCLLLVTKLFRQ